MVMKGPPRGALLLACTAVRTPVFRPPWQSAHTDTFFVICVQAEHAWKLSVDGTFPARDKKNVKGRHGGPRKTNPDLFSEKTAAGRAELYHKSIKVLDDTAWKKILDAERKISNSAILLNSDGKDIEDNMDMEVMFSDPIEVADLAVDEEEVW